MKAINELHELLVGYKGLKHWVLKYASDLTPTKEKRLRNLITELVRLEPKAYAEVRGLVELVSG